MPPSVVPRVGCAISSAVDVRRANTSSPWSRRLPRYGSAARKPRRSKNIETLTGKYGEEGNKLIFKVLRRGEHESSARPTWLCATLTCRWQGGGGAWGSCRGLSSGIRYQPVVARRLGRRAAGFASSISASDAIGSKSMVVETELCSAVARRASSGSGSPTSSPDNHRSLLSGLLEAAGVAAEMHGQALVALDKMDRIGADGVRRELQERGITPMATACWRPSLPIATLRLRCAP